MTILLPTTWARNPFQDEHAEDMTKHNQTHLQYMARKFHAAIEPQNLISADRNRVGLTSRHFI